MGKFFVILHNVISNLSIQNITLMKKLDLLLAEKLLKISAIKLQPDNPFTWASGWNSPIYTDNRKTLSYPELRNFIKVELSRLILENFGDAEVVAGVATGAIAQGALVADTLGLPFVYIRSTPKDHGLEKHKLWPMPAARSWAWWLFSPMSSRLQPRPLRRLA